MSVLVRHEGAGWNAELYQAVLDRVIPDPSKPPAGLEFHVAGPLPEGGWQVIEVWETEETCREFMERHVRPAAQEISGPPFDTNVSPVYFSLVAAKRGMVGA